MRSHFLFAFLILVHLGSSTFTVDLTKNNKYDNDTLLNTLCNKDTQIDFGFSSSTMMKCSNSSCSLTVFLNII